MDILKTKVSEAKACLDPSTTSGNSLKCCVFQSINLDHTTERKPRPKFHLYLVQSQRYSHVYFVIIFLRKLVKECQLPISRLDLAMLLCRIFHLHTVQSHCSLPKLQCNGFPFFRAILFRNSVLDQLDQCCFLVCRNDLHRPLRHLPRISNQRYLLHLQRDKNAYLSPLHKILGNLPSEEQCLQFHPVLIPSRKDKRESFDSSALFFLCVYCGKLLLLRECR